MSHEGRSNTAHRRITKSVLLRQKCQSRCNRYDWIAYSMQVTIFDDLNVYLKINAHDSTRASRCFVRPASTSLRFECVAKSLSLPRSFLLPLHPPPAVILWGITHDRFLLHILGQAISEICHEDPISFLLLHVTCHHVHVLSFCSFSQ